MDQLIVCFAAPLPECSSTADSSAPVETGAVPQQPAPTTLPTNDYTLRGDSFCVIAVRLRAYAGRLWYLDNHLRLR